MESVGASGAEWIVPVLMGVSLAACAGIRAWLPLLFVSVLAHFGYVQVNDSMAVIGDIYVLVALVIATVVEMIGDKIPAQHKPAIEQALQQLKDAHKAGDVAAIDAAIAALNQAWQTASQQMYAQSGAAGQPGGDTYQGGQQQQSQQTQSGSTDETIQDADFEEVK